LAASSIADPFVDKRDVPMFGCREACYARYRRAFVPMDNSTDYLRKLFYVLKVLFGHVYYQELSGSTVRLRARGNPRFDARQSR